MSRISENRYGWEYAFELGNETPYQITPPNEIKRKIPETLYKYSGLTENSVEALKEKYIYAPHPQQLNDPFDCYERLIGFDDPNAIRKFLAGSMEPDKLEEALKFPSDEFKHFVQYNFSLIIYSKIGILSLTEDPHSMLMWAYYSLHQGFAIEYNFKKFNFRYHGPFQMNYQKELNAMSIKYTGICVPYQSNLKSKEWEHEMEWRIIPEVSDGK
ncbi:MAG: DUF2971 domain-containing protein, partial [Flavobacteriales bacterium]|nr:DUF2971 domain-containing protein [Flavobacteriales bacterium]